MVVQLLEQIGAGIGLGSVYALVALGFVLIYKATEVVNFATGALMMLGPFLFYSLVVFFHFPIWLGIAVSIVCMAMLGAGIDRFILRRLLGEPMLSIVLATLAVGIIIDCVAGIIWGFEPVAAPELIPNQAVRLVGITLSSAHTLTIVVLTLLIIMLFIFFRHTKIGIAMQATAQNQFSAYMMGINVGGVFSLSWAISAVICCIAGIVLIPISSLHVHMTHIGLMAFPAAILGGLSSIPGAVVGGLIIGLTENLASYYLPLIKDSLPFIVLILVLMIKPEGIFGIHERKKV